LLLAFIGNASAQKAAGCEQKEIAEAFSITATRRKPLALAADVYGF
jgi:hypothetical protein